LTAQRLVRRVCKECSQVIEAAELSSELDAALRSRGLSTAVRKTVGCAHCDHSGYKGRLSLVELLEVPEALSERIAAGASTEELRAEALRMGCLHTMTEDILRHLAAGTTTLDEVEGQLELEMPQPVAPKHETAAAQSAAPPAAPVRFSAAAPLPPTPSPAPAAPESAASAPSVTTAVLAVGDAPAREIVTAALAGGSVQSTHADSGQTAVALAVKAQPDLLVAGPPSATLDVAGLISLVRTVLGLRGFPILALASSDEEGEKLLQAGADDYLLLPLRPASTQARLRSVLGRREPWAAVEDVMRPRIPANEGERLADLHSLNILDTPPEERFDRLTREAAEHFGVPLWMVSLVDSDRQWWKSHHGTEDTGTSRDISICGHAVLGQETFVVEDAYLDARFVDNPLVTGESQVRFYAGYPMKGPAGQNIGSFCIVDHKPRHMSQQDIRVLEELGRRAEAELAEK